MIVFLGEGAGACLPAALTRHDPGGDMGDRHVSMIINAPPERVFKLYTDPGRAREWLSGVREVRATGPPDQPGSRAVITYRWPFTMTAEVLGAEPPHLHVQRLKELLGLVTCTTTARFRPVEGATELGLEMDYRVAGGPIGRLFDGRVGNEMATTVGEDLARLKALAEEQAGQRRVGPGGGGMRMRTPQPATLQGRAVRLRPVTADDAPRLTEILSHPEVARWWGRYDRDRVQRELVDPNDGTVTFAIQADGQAIGLIQYWEEPDPDYRHAALDLFLHPDWHGRGLGADAIRTLARHLFEDRGHHRLTIDPAAANQRAIRAYRRVGFRPVGVLRRYERGPDGSWHDGLLMDLLPEDLTDPTVEGSSE